MATGQIIVFPMGAVFQGPISAQGFNLGNGSVTDANIATAAGIQATKVIHSARPGLFQGSATTAAAQTQAVYTCIAAGGATVITVEAWAIVAALGADTCSVDVKISGTSILSAPISLTSSQTARQIVTGAITTPAMTTGQILEVVITPNHTSGTLPSGVGVQIQVTEATQ